MPALPIIPNCYRVAFVWSGYSSSAINVMHFVKPASSSSAVASIILTDWQAGMLTPVGNSASIDTLHITPLDGTTASSDYATGSSGKWVGTQSGDVIPAQAAVVKLSTPLRGRSRRGRVFLPWIAEVSSTVGVMSTGLTTTTETAWNAFLTALNASALTWSVASYKLSSSYAITGVTVEAALGTQRRRQTRYRP
jgi:hypothetical protein